LQTLRTGRDRIKAAQRAEHASSHLRVRSGELGLEGAQIEVDRARRQVDAHNYCTRSARAIQS
jgi:hypothetical protein